jgi:hypothetical protein
VASDPTSPPAAADLPFPDLPTAPEGTQRTAVVPGLDPALGARRFVPTRLHVIDAITMTELPEIELGRAIDAPLGLELLRTRLGADFDESSLFDFELVGDSPLALTAPDGFAAPDGLEVVHVRSPGYVLGSLEIDHLHGGERAIELERVPLGVLEVRAMGGVASRGQLMVLVRGADFRLVAFEPGTSVPVEDLPPGRYDVELQRMPWTLGRSEATVVAGRTTVVDVPVEDELLGAGSW